MDGKWESFQEAATITCNDCKKKTLNNFRADARKWARVHFLHTGHRQFEIEIIECYFLSEVIE